MAMNPVDHPHGGGNHQHIGHASTMARDAPAGTCIGWCLSCRGTRIDCSIRSESRSYRCSPHGSSPRYSGQRGERLGMRVKVVMCCTLSSAFISWSRASFMQAVFLSADPGARLPLHFTGAPTFLEPDRYTLSVTFVGNMADLNV